MKILIITGGNLGAHADRVWKTMQPDYVIAADRGLRHAMSLQIRPDFVLGDFDSADPETIGFLKNSDIPFQVYPREKDYTDTELALIKAMDLVGDDPQDSDIAIIGGTGTRMDHTLATILMLKRTADAGIHCAVVDENNCIQMIKGPTQLTVQRSCVKDFISLIPVFGDAEDVTLEGMYYPLHGQTLKSGASQGISNRIIEDVARITLGSGYLLVIRASD